MFQGTPTTLDISLSTAVFVPNGASAAAPSNPTGLICEVNQLSYGQSCGSVGDYNGVGLVVQFTHSPYGYQVQNANQQSLLNVVVCRFRCRRQLTLLSQAQIAALFSLCFTGASIALRAVDLITATKAGRRMTVSFEATASRCACCGGKSPKTVQDPASPASGAVAVELTTPAVPITTETT